MAGHLPSGLAFREKGKIRRFHFPTLEILHRSYLRSDSKGQICQLICPVELAWSARVQLRQRVSPGFGGRLSHCSSKLCPETAHWGQWERECVGRLSSWEGKGTRPAEWCPGESSVWRDAAQADFSALALWTGWPT